MYVPKNYHFAGPVGTVLVGLASQQAVIAYFGRPSWEVAIAELVLFKIAVEWAKYLFQAGVAYQNYETHGGGTGSEAEHFAEARARVLAEGMVLATGNAGTVVPLAQNVTKKHSLTPEMVTNQFVAEAPELEDGYLLKADLKKICKRQLIYRKHPDLGYPEGDYREVTWIEEMTRKRLTTAVSVLEFAGGICRKGSAKNSPYVTRDWTVIELAAHGEGLPLPQNMR